MRKLCIFILPLFICAVMAACDNDGKNAPLTISQSAINQLEQIKQQDKFAKIQKQALASPKLKDTITVLVNKAADDFINTAKNQPTDAKFQMTMRKALARFSHEYSEFDSDNKALVESYFEQMMKIVGVEDHEGILHKWQYGMINADDESN